MPTRRMPKHASEQGDKLIRLMWAIRRPKKSKVISLRIPEDLHAFLKTLAEINGTTITDLLIDGAVKKAEEYLRDYEGPIHSDWMEMFPEYFGKKF